MTADLPPYLLDRADEKIGRWFAEDGNDDGVAVFVSLTNLTDCDPMNSSAHALMCSDGISSAEK